MTSPKEMLHRLDAVLLQTHTRMVHTLYIYSVTLYPDALVSVQMWSLNMQWTMPSWGSLTSAPGLCRKLITTHQPWQSWTNSRRGRRWWECSRRLRTASESYTVTSQMVSERGECQIKLHLRALIQFLYIVQTAVISITLQHNKL